MSGTIPGLLPAPRHDAGGKTRLALLPGVRGRAVFAGDDDEHRLTLWRVWGNPEPYLLSIGMNPSTAEADVDDNTVRIEQRFAREWGFTAYCKTNVMSHRVTKPEGLLVPGIQPSLPRNVETIRSVALSAGLILLTIGSLPKRLRPYGEEVVRTLHEAGLPLWCLGTTADGSPRHVRGLPADARRQPFNPEPYLRGSAA